MTAVGSFEDLGLSIQDPTRQFKSLECSLCLFLSYRDGDVPVGQVNIVTQCVTSPYSFGKGFDYLLKNSAVYHFTFSEVVPYKIGVSPALDRVRQYIIAMM